MLGEQSYKYQLEILVVKLDAWESNEKVMYMFICDNTTYCALLALSQFKQCHLICGNIHEIGALQYQ